MFENITPDQAIEAIGKFNIEQVAVLAKYDAEGPGWATQHWSPWYLSLDANNHFFTSHSSDGSHKASSAGSTFALVFDDPVEFADPSNGTPLQDLLAPLGELSWVLQTSPRKYQAGLILEPNALNIREINKLMAALQDKLPEGAIDKGPGSRMARLPGINNKKEHVEALGGRAFESRYTEWRPGNLFSVGSLAYLAGLTLEEIKEAAATSQSTLSLDEDHPVLKNSLINVIGQHPDYGYLIDCPWKDEHTSNDTPALLTISEERVVGFKCMHAHCAKRDGKVLLSHLDAHEKGTLSAVVKYRKEKIMSEIHRIREDMEVLTPEVMEKKYPDEVARLQAEYVFISSQNRFLHLPSGTYLTKEAFNQAYGHLDKAPAKLLYGISDCNALVATTHFGKERFFTEDHKRCVNLFTPTALRHGTPGDAEPFVEHAKHVYGEHADHVLKFMAFSIRKPEIKINHMIILGGAKGIGKDALLQPIIHHFGRYAKCIETSSLIDRFNSYLDATKFLVIGELSSPTKSEGNEVHNNIKRILASPPDTIPINRKGIAEYYIPNLVSVMATTNHRTPLSVEAESRRFFMIFSDLRSTPENIERAQDLYRWYDQGGLAKAVHYLENLDIGDFDPKAAPPVTEMLADTAESSKTILHHAIDEMANRMADGEYVVGPLLSVKEIRDQLLVWKATTSNEGVGLPPENKLAVELKRMGYEAVTHDGKRSDAPRKLWILRDASKIAQLFKQDQLALYVPPPTGENIM